MEEFNIVPLNLIHLGTYKAENRAYFDSQLYFTDEFVGIPTIDKNEFIGQAEWFTLEELQEKQLFPPFKDSLNKLKQFLQKFLTLLDNKNTINSDDGSHKYPDDDGGYNRISFNQAKKLYKEGKLDLEDKNIIGQYKHVHRTFHGHVVGQNKDIYK